MFYAISESFASLNDFMTAGGPVLWLIAFLAFFMWALIIERIWYFNSGHNTFMSTIKQKWDSISDHTSWESSQIKEKLRSEAKEEIVKHMSLIQTCVALAPLFGLLGTVTGMIVTFQQITLFGTGDPKIMAGGISQALVTTVLGLVVAIPTTLAHSFLQSSARSVVDVLEEQATGIVAEKAK